jgi:hypothetical protein
MQLYCTRSIAVFFIVAIYCVLNSASALAQYMPPDNVTLVVYHLETDGSIFRDRTTERPVPCTKGDLSYGCTSDSAKPYPFDTSTITIGIDGTDGPDNAQYDYPYLWDVVPQELDMNGSQGNKPLSAVTAQAIAARTYIYQRMLYLDQYGTPNNSTQFHVFLPYRYALLTDTQKERVQAAMASRAYMTESSSTYPIESLYGADNPATTVEGNRSYLQSVADPISADYGVVDGTTNGGMSSKGASRWSFGHTSSRGPVAADNAQYPHDVDGLGDFWSVRLDDAFQILTHYYTGVHIRDANNPATILTPDDRWAPLELTIPNAGCLHRGIPVQLALQNSGVSTWNEGTEVQLGYSAIYIGNVGPSATELSGAATYVTAPAEPATLGPNGMLRIPFTVKPEAFPGGQGRYRLRFDMYRNNQSFANLAAGQGKRWPQLEREVALYDCAHELYAPLVQRSPIVTESSH